MLHDPGNKQVAKELYVAASRDKEGREGVIGMQVPGIQGTLPALGIHKDQVVRMAEMFMRDTRGRSDKTIHVLRFTREGEVPLG